jgi:hypothetical protein
LRPVNMGRVKSGEPQEEDRVCGGRLYHKARSSQSQGVQPHEVF